MKINQALKEGYQYLKKNNIDTYNLDTELLLGRCLNKTREEILLNFDKEISYEEYESYRKFLNVRAKQKPIAQIISKKNFWKNDFFVNENVLIPRPDTEILIEEALKLSRHKNNINILDIGVGSGCILLSLLLEIDHSRGTGIDISKECIKVAKINTNNLGLENRTKLFKTDIDNLRVGKYDLIVSNPPYISRAEIKYLSREVRNYEPFIALDGGIDGLVYVAKVINNSFKLLKKNGTLILEISSNQKNMVEKLLINSGFFIKNFVKDYANNFRCVISKKIK